jgi:hypothetical protein
VISPSFEWFFDNGSLPSDTSVSNVLMSGNTYISSLYFFPLQVFHTGLYTCHLGGNQQLASNTTVTVVGSGKCTSCCLYLNY